MCGAGLCLAVGGELDCKDLRGVLIVLHAEQATARESCERIEMLLQRGGEGGVLERGGRSVREQARQASGGQRARDAADGPPGKQRISVGRLVERRAPSGWDGCKSERKYGNINGRTAVQLPCAVRKLSLERHDSRMAVTIRFGVVWTFDGQSKSK